jgi:hypothetical protein
MASDVLEMTAKILSSRKISRWEHQRMAALLNANELHEQDRVLIERIFYGVRHGLLMTIE